jgi:hypothetical protein
VARGHPQGGGCHPQTPSFLFFFFFLKKKLVFFN